MIKDVRVALREWPAPEAGSELRERILMSRAGGGRVQLPVGRSAAWRLRFLVAAAAAVAIVAIANRTPLGRGRADQGVYADLLSGAPWWPTVSAAQEPRMPLRAPRYPPIGTLDLSRVAGGTWTYEGRTTTDGIHTGVTDRLAITASAARLDGTPVWLLTTERSPIPDAADSLFVSQATLRPLRYAVNGSNSRTHIVQQYSADSVHETIDITGRGERHLLSTVALPGALETPGLVLSPFATDLNLLSQALPLRQGWRGSAFTFGLMSPTGPIPPFVPIDFRVIDRDLVTVPAGTFDCWKLEVVQGYEGEARSHLWVSRDRQWIVKAEYRGGEFVTEQILTSYAVVR